MSNDTMRVLARTRSAVPPIAVFTSEPATDPLPSLGFRGEEIARDHSFLVGRLLTATELREAIGRAKACGRAVHRVLIAEGALDAARYTAALAVSLELPFLPEPAMLGLVSGGGHLSGRAGWAEGMIDGARWTALDGTLGTPSAVGTIARKLAARGIRVGLSPPSGLRDCVLASARAGILRQAITGLARQDPSFSARAGSWMWQSLSLAVSVGSLIGLAAIAGISAQWLLAVLLTLPILAGVALRLLVLLAYPLARPRKLRAKAQVKDRDLPVYTLLVPLYREARSRYYGANATTEKRRRCHELSP